MSATIGSEPKDPKSLRDRLSALLGDFETKAVLVEFASILYVDAVQQFADPSDVPDLDRDIINLGCQYREKSESDVAFDAFIDDLVS